MADVSTSGLITAKVVGKTRVVGKAKGVESGVEVVYSSVCFSFLFFRHQLFFLVCNSVIFLVTSLF